MPIPTKAESRRSPRHIATSARSAHGRWRSPIASISAIPQRPEIMAQFVGCLEGMGEACRALDFPIVSGNVRSTTKARRPAAVQAILPTPAIGGVGLLDDTFKMATIGFKNEGDVVWLIGVAGGHLGQSLWLRELHGREEGLPPPVDLAAERKAGEVRARADQGGGGQCSARHFRRWAVDRAGRDGACRRDRRRN